MPPLPPSSVDTALSATSEVDGVTVTVISSPAFAAAVTSPVSSAAIVATAAALPRSVVARERSARCRNDHKPASFRCAATALLLSADDSSCRKRDSIKPTARASPIAEPEVRGRAFLIGYCRRDAAPFINLPQDFRATLLTIFFFPGNGNSYRPHKSW